MKSKFLSIVVLGLILIAMAHGIGHIIRAAVAPVQPSGEFWINTSKSTNLNSDAIRVTNGRLIVDNALTNWVLKIHFECWKTNGNPVIVSRGVLDVNVSTDLKAVLNAANPKTVIKNNVLSAAGLSEKP